MSSYVVNWNWAWLALTMAPVLWVMVRWRRNAHQLECELVNGIKKSRDLPAEAMFIVEPMDHVGDWLLNNGHIDWETVTMLIKDGRTDEVVEALVRCGPIADDVDADFRRSLLYFLSAEKASYDELVAKGLIREKVDHLVQSLLKDGRIDWEIAAELIRSGRIDETIEGLIRCGQIGRAHV